jgi:hypothetical protein
MNGAAMEKTLIKIDKKGQISFIYNDELRPLLKQGSSTIKRVSHVEPTSDGKWEADMSPVKPGVKLGPFETREEALQEEVKWLKENVLS